MSSKQAILERVKANINFTAERPKVALKGITYPDKVEQFITISKGVGGDAVVVKADAIEATIKKLYPDAKTIASNLKNIAIATVNPDTLADPRELNGTDLGIIRGEWGVAENGCVWIAQNVKHKALYFISEHLIILLDKDKIVNNMHEAYRNISFHDSGFGIFISGPSKTADIEQALVVGAHGAKGVTVLLVDKD